MFGDEDDEEAYGQATDRQNVFRTSSGEEYQTIGVISIEKIGVKYPIIDRTTDATMKISPTKFWGPNPNEVGNLCIVAHNYTYSMIYERTIFFPHKLRYCPQSA